MFKNDWEFAIERERARFERFFAIFYFWGFGIFKFDSENEENERLFEIEK